MNSMYQASQPLPPGVQNGSYQIRATNAGTVEIDVREFIGWWETEQSNFVRRVREAKPSLIKLSIASEGGFVSDALAIHDFLRSYDARVEVEITGLTASAATIIAMAGDHIRMSDNALFLVHYASAGLFAWGPAEDIEEAAGQLVRALRMINGRLVNLYAKKTRQPESALGELMRAEAWLTAEETKAWGFIDSVFEPSKSGATNAAYGPLRAVAHAPAPEVLRALHLPPLPAVESARARSADDEQRRVLLLQAARRM